MSIMVKTDDMLHKYNIIWNKIKEKLKIKFHSMAIYDENYIKAKVRRRHCTASAADVISNALDLT